MLILNIKILKLEKFKGKRVKLQLFLVQIDIYIIINTNILGGDKGKIIYIVTYLKGVAFR